VVSRWWKEVFSLKKRSAIFLWLVVTDDELTISPTLPKQAKATVANLNAPTHFPSINAHCIEVVRR
jgi:hypothetical protein